MTYLKRAFFALVFLTFLHPECSKSYFFQGSVGKPEKENLKCLSKQSNEQLQIQDQLAVFLALDIFKRSQKKPVERIVQVGTNFTYGCCGKEGAVFRWGLYEKGVWSPSIFFSRVEINKDGTYCSVFWTPIFRNSTYFGRTFADYNTSSKCVQWTMSDVTMEDNNVTFVAVVRDNSAQGQGFRECTPVLLNASEAETPSPAATTVRTQNQSEPSTEGPDPEPAPPTKTPPKKPVAHNNSFKWWYWLFIVVAVAVVAVSVAFVIYLHLKHRKRSRNVVFKDNSEDEGESGSKDNLL